MAERPKETRGELERRFARCARRMLLSNNSVEWMAESCTAGQIGAACMLLEHELEVREVNKKARMLKAARFPAIKSVEGYDFSDVAFHEGYTYEEMLTMEFVQCAQDFVFYGGCGRGKTHLSIALGMLALEKGYHVRYFEAANLVLQLKAASASGTLEKTLASIAKADLLIVDEFGYIPIDVEGARLLYQVISDTYEKRSLIVTTNIEFSKWGTVLADDHLASAMCDRLFHHGRLVEFTGDSKRLSASLMMGRGRN